MQTDPFKGISKGLSTPADCHFAITPNDNEDLPFLPRSIYVGTGGDIAVRDRNGVDVTYTVTDGQTLLFRATRVLSTGTTATSLVGWY